MFDALYTRKKKLAVVGLGYVGLPLAAAFSQYYDVIGFDIDEAKIEMLKEGQDITGEVGNNALRELDVTFTSDPKKLAEASFYIVAVPTPVNADRTPDLRPVVGASKLVGRCLAKGDYVVYESTVYPGLTEEICVPLLEKESGLRCGQDFKVGYSPERINPGDKEHRLTTIIKVVAGQDAETLDQVASVYGQVIKAGVYRAESIKVAEAAKVIENSQRDINIAFVNELSLIFNRMGIDTKAVLRAASTKWNFLPFQPGLVGGHCIGVDPYYLTYKAEALGYHSEVILAGRRINDTMGKYVAEQTVKMLIKAGCSVKGSRVLVLGLTFKENVPDIRNTRVIDIINELNEYGVEVQVADPMVEPAQAQHEYEIELNNDYNPSHYDGIILAVAHDTFRSLDLADLKRLCRFEQPVLVDIKGMHERAEVEAAGFYYWRL